MWVVGGFPSFVPENCQNLKDSYFLGGGVVVALVLLLFGIYLVWCELKNVDNIFIRPVMTVDPTEV